MSQKAEKMLELMNHLFREALGASPQATIVVDDDGNIVDVVEPEDVQNATAH